MGSKERKRWLAANVQEEHSVPAGPHTKRAIELGTRSLAAAMSELKELTVEQGRRDKENMESQWVSRSRAIKDRGTRVASYTFERGLGGRDKGTGHSDDESSDSDSDLSQRISWLQGMPLSQILHPPHVPAAVLSPNLRNRMAHIHDQWDNQTPPRASRRAVDRSPLALSNPRWRLLERAIEQTRFASPERTGPAMHEGARERVRNWMKRNPAGTVGQHDASTRRQLFELGARKGLENVLVDIVPLDERAFRRADRTKSVACDLGVGALTLHIRRLEDKIEGLIGVVSGQSHNRSGVFGRGCSLGGVFLGQADESERFKGEEGDTLQGTADTSAAGPHAEIAGMHADKIYDTLDHVLHQLKQAGDDALQVAGASVTARPASKAVIAKKRKKAAGFDSSALSWLQSADSALKLLQQVAATRISIQLATATCWAESSPNSLKTKTCKAMNQKQYKRISDSTKRKVATKAVPLPLDRIHRVGQGTSASTPQDVFKGYSLKPPWH